MLERIKQLDLEKHFNLTDEAFQNAMAVDLRRIVFEYLRGTLKDRDGNPIPDGPAVISLREGMRNRDIVAGMEDIEDLGSMEEFIAKQSRAGAYATSIELTLLSELFGRSLVVQYAGTNQSTVLYAAPKELNPVPFVLLNTKTTETYWDPIINGKKSSKTVHKGDCGYTSIAQILDAEVRPQIQKKVTNVATVFDSGRSPVKPDEIHYVRAVQEYKDEENAFKTYMDGLNSKDKKEYKRVQEQIAKDYQLALELALEDLPSASGKTNHAPNRGLFSKAQLAKESQKEIERSFRPRF